MARKNSYPRIQIRQLPILSLKMDSELPQYSGLEPYSSFLPPIGMSSTYLPKAPTTMTKINNPAIGNSSSLSAYAGLANAVLGAAGTYGQTGSIGKTVSNLVDTGIKSIPVAGQIIAAADMVLDPLASAIGGNSPTDQLAQIAKRTINPLKSLKSGITNLIDGNSSEGWNDLLGTVLPPIAGYNDAMKARKEREEIDRKNRIEFDEQHKQQEIKEGYSWRYGDQLPKAKNGGFLQPNDPKLSKGRLNPFYYQTSTELATSIGGENNEPAYLIPSFKYGQLLDNPVDEYNKTGEHLGGPFKTWQEADKWDREVRHPYVEKGQPIPSPLKTWGEIFEMGGELPTTQAPQITSYGGNNFHDSSPNGGIPVDARGNPVITSNGRPVALVQSGEVGYFSEKLGKTYIFSDDLYEK